MSEARLWDRVYFYCHPFFFFQNSLIYLPYISRVVFTHTRWKRKNKDEKAGGVKMKKWEKEGVRRRQNWAVKDGMREIFIKMLNFLSFLDQSELMENDLHYNVWTYKKKKVPARECGRGANRLHIKPSFFDVNCPAQLSPRTCVNPDAFMDGFRLTVCVLQPYTNLSQTCHMN